MGHIVAHMLRLCAAGGPAGLPYFSVRQVATLCVAVTCAACHRLVGQRNKAAQNNWRRVYTIDPRGQLYSYRRQLVLGPHVCGGLNEVESW
jgi:hypothetical protein